MGLIKDGCKGTVRLEVSGRKHQRKACVDGQYSDLQLYNQLLYFNSLFDVERALTKVRGTARYGVFLAVVNVIAAYGRLEEIHALATANAAALNQLAAVTDKYLDKNGRRYVDIKSLFGFMERIRI